MSSKTCSKDEGPSTIEEASGLGKHERHNQPGLQHAMEVKPVVHHLPAQTDSEETPLEPYRAAGKLTGKTAIITGGDSGIGASVASLYAMEGASALTITYVDRESKDAEEVKSRIENQSKCRVNLVPVDIGIPENCKKVVDDHVNNFGKLDILVNNASEQHLCEKFDEIPVEQIERTFRTNIFGMMFTAKYALKHMRKGCVIINTTSVTAFKGKPDLVDYSATKGAIVSFTRALALQLASKGIRVNGVAPGPIITPLIPASFKPEQMEVFGKETPMGRPGQPSEVAPSYVFLASSDSSYITGQIIHVNGGTPV
ncbi:hypothetical protein BZG36_01955 [Bifiguratus adelaidae]|uniref:Glucose and ribitol dehydrogenase n=1 Tax=Bifiguratus adelaidae TaxID=1938954 RepID=A0A261Y3Z3_9FUNG|nr:hypothetical protein BZG36_01955 [Bifiguratus adelaidae]